MENAYEVFRVHLDSQHAFSEGLVICAFCLVGKPIERAISFYEGVANDHDENREDQKEVVFQTRDVVEVTWNDPYDPLDPMVVAARLYLQACLFHHLLPCLLLSS